MAWAATLLIWITPAAGVHWQSEMAIVQPARESSDPKRSVRNATGSMNAESEISKDGPLTSSDGVRKIARALAQPVTYLGIAMLVFIYCALTYLLIADRKEAYKEAQIRGKNLVQIIEQSFLHIFKSADATLLFLRKSYRQNPETFDLATWVHDPSIRNELTFNFMITDANGRAVDASGSKKLIGLDLSDREYFRKQLSSDADNLIISKPLTLKVTRKVAMVLSRRITAPNGTFSGIVTLLISPSELVEHIGALDLGPDGSIALVGLDGVVRARAVNGALDRKVIGRHIPTKNSVLGRAEHTKAGVYWNTPALIDNVSRLVAYRVLGSFPMIAIVAISEAEVYRRANENARIYWGIALLLTAAILIGIGLGARREQKLIDTTSKMKQTKEELRRSQERYKLVEDAVNDGIWDRNLITGEGFYSSRWRKILGYPEHGSPHGTSLWYELIHPDDRAAVAEAMRAHLEEDVPYKIDYRLLRSDGSYCWIRSRGKAVRDAANRPVRMVGTITDITERKQADALIEESRNNLERAETMARLGHYKLLQGESALTWSEGVYRIFDKQPGHFTPTLQAVLDLIHPDDRPVLEQYRRDVLGGLEPPRITLRAVMNDGQIKYVECWSQPIRSSDGAITGIFGTLQDVTARKQAEALVEESRDNLARAEMVALLGHYQYKCASDEYTWSESVYRIMGKSPNSFTPTLSAVLELFHPDDRPALERQRRDVLAGIELPPSTKRVIKDDGQIIYVEAWSTPLRASDGSVIGMFGTIQDVTARKQAEAMLARTNQELEERVAARTAELAQEMRRREEAQMTLAQMQKMEAVGQLTAGVAHDFNNLLAVIQGSLGFVETAAARGLTAEQELIDAALRATRRGRELVQRLLAFSRQAPLKAQPTAIDQLVLDMLRLLQRTLGAEIEIITRLDAAAAAASVDRNQLASALLNLALNARDAMPAGGQLTIATRCQPAQSAAADGAARWPTGEEICIVVGDTGDGMTEEARQRAFEPFFTTKPDGLGTGLGLSMVHGFVEQSGGHIEIDSASGRGTTVTIRLPRIAAASEADEPAMDLSTADREKTVLLVEDDPDVRTVTAAQLKQLGYKVHAVATGMEALDLIVSPATIDITLTDIVLPGGIDGVTLVKEVMRARPGMGILCMSGYDPTQKNSKWFKVQNIEFLEKPFSSSRLAQALDAAIAR
jgi:PAS domain S-box-containing protein